MPYPRKLLNDYESVVLDLHPHWWYFAEAALALALAIVLSIVAVVFWDPPSWVKWVLLAFIVVSAIALAIRYIKWATTNFVVTTHRIIFREGLLSKTGIEIPLQRVNNVLFHQGPFERMIGAGDLLIESAGETGQQQFTDVRGPARVQNLINAQMEMKERRDEGGGGSAGTDGASQLEKLEGMRDRGSLTPEEFEAQKRRLLGLG